MENTAGWWMNGHIYPTVSESVFDLGEFFFIMEIYKQAK